MIFLSLGKFKSSWFLILIDIRIFCELYEVGVLFDVFIQCDGVGIWLFKVIYFLVEWFIVLIFYKRIYDEMVLKFVLECFYFDDDINRCRIVVF